MPAPPQQFREKPGDQVTFSDHSAGAVTERDRIEQDQTRQFLVGQLPRHLDSDVAAEGPSTDVVRAVGAHPTNRRDIRRGQVAHRAKRCRSGLGTCRLQRIDRLIGRKVLDEIEIAQDISADRVDQEQRWTIARGAQRDKGIERPDGTAGRDQAGECAGVGAVTNASSGISTPHVRAIAMTTRIAPIDVPPASKKLVSAAKLCAARELRHDVRDRLLVSVARRDAGR